MNWRALVVGTILALFLAFFGAYLVVVSQNASAVHGPQFVYGSPSPGP
jgi:hypothetical protein